MPVESYPTDQYPLGCVGWCFVLSANVIRDLYWMSLDTPLIFLEDVTTTGILREKVSRPVALFSYYNLFLDWYRQGYQNAGKRAMVPA